MPQAAHSEDFERSDAPPWLLASLAGGLALIVVGLMIALGALFPQAFADRPKGPVGPPPPAPRLQIDPKADLIRLRASEALAESRIDQAMRAVAAEGWRDEGR